MPIPEPVEEPAPAEETPVEPEAAEQTAPDLPSDAGQVPDRPADRTAEPSPQQPVAEPRPRLDMNRALRDFGRTASQRPRPVTPPTQGGGRAPSNVFVPDLSAVPTTGFGMGNLTFESTDFDWSDYGRQIYMAIWRAWHNRLYQTTNEFDKWAHNNRSWYLDHQSAVRFVIERNGDVTGIAIEGTSGCSPLDRSAVDALDEVILPPLPAAFPRDREVVHARFITQGDVRSMKQILQHYRQMGLF